VSAAVNTSGLVVSRRLASPAMGAVWYYFGEYEPARRLYVRLVGSSRYSVAWLDNLAAVEVGDGHPERARRFYARAVTLEHDAGRHDAYRVGQLAASLALEGDLDAAMEELDALLAVEMLPEPLANRGAIRAVRGDLVAAEVDLRAALALEPEQVPAWVNLARVLERSGQAEPARRVWQRAGQQACRPPRGYPYGVGTGEVLDWGIGRRLLLVIDGDSLEAVLPADTREACRRFGTPGEPR